MTQDNLERELEELIAKLECNPDKKYTQEELDAAVEKAVKKLRAENKELKEQMEVDEAYAREETRKLLSQHEKAAAYLAKLREEGGYSISDKEKEANRLADLALKQFDSAKREARAEQDAEADELDELLIPDFNDTRKEPQAALVDAIVARKKQEDELRLRDYQKIKAIRAEQGAKITSAVNKLKEVRGEKATLDAKAKSLEDKLFSIEIDELERLETNPDKEELGESETLLAIASRNSIFFVDPTGDKRIKHVLTRNGYERIEALRVHDGRLYDGTRRYPGYAIFDTLRGKLIARRKGVLAGLFSYEKMLFDVETQHPGKPHRDDEGTLFMDVFTSRGFLYKGKLSLVHVHDDGNEKCVYASAGPIIFRLAGTNDLVHSTDRDFVDAEPPIIASRGTSGVIALCTNKGRLYDATPHEVYDTFDNESLVRKNTRSLVSHNGKLFDLGDNNWVCETVSGIKAGRVTGYSTVVSPKLVSLNSNLYYAGDRLVDIFAGKVVFDAPVNDVISVPRSLVETLINSEASNAQR